MLKFEKKKIRRQKVNTVTNLSAVFPPNGVSLLGLKYATRVHIISKNLRYFSKFLARAGWRKAGSVLGTHKYYEKQFKIGAPE